VKGAPGGERWEIYAVLQDSPTFWGHDSVGRPETDEAGSASPSACCA
jgi:hypothetical protein